jgi:type I restriction enzyme S subunit
LTEQQQVVARIEELAGKIQEARRLRTQATGAVRALVLSAMHNLKSRVVPTGTLGEVLAGKPRNGWSAKCDNAEGGVAVLSLGSVTGFHYRSTEFKRTSLHASTEGHFWLDPGDLLITRSNSPELVGHAAIYSGEPSPCIYPDLMMRLAVKREVAETRFVWYWLQSPTVREFIARNAKGTSPTMKKVSQGIVAAIPYPTSLTLSEQRRIVAELDALQAQVDASNRLQAETAAELDALLPTILDRAFKGELA